MSFNFTGLQNKERGKGTHSSVKERERNEENIQIISAITFCKRYW